jgi:hypothetical protein
VEWSVKSGIEGWGGRWATSTAPTVKERIHARPQRADGVGQFGQSRPKRLWARQGSGHFSAFALTSLPIHYSSVSHIACRLHERARAVEVCYNCPVIRVLRGELDWERLT